jgi:signal transduction histidine kinase
MIPVALAIAIGAGLVSASVLFRPAHAVDSDGRAALEATIMLTAIATACLLIVNLKRARKFPNVLLLCGLIALSFADFVYSGLPALQDMRGLESNGGLRLGTELVAALAFAGTALAAVKPRSEPRRGPIRFELEVAAAAVLLASLVAVFIAVADTALAVYTTSAAILVAAAVAFLARPEGAGGRSALLAAASLLLAGADLRYLAAPAVATDWVTPRDGLRLAAYVLLLAGAALQHAKLQRKATYAAIRSDRERIARDLHDGLAQDLACIAAQGQRLDCQLGAEHPLMVAAHRALTASRGVIADLTASAAPSTEAALRVVANELEYRYDVQVKVRVETDRASSADDDFEPAKREHLVRIAREAIVNAAQHGAARNVDVVLLRRQGTLLMRVSDDGGGISDGKRNGFGLRSMQARAASLGGQLSAHPRSGGGTDVELLVS